MAGHFNPRSIASGVMRMSKQQYTTVFGSLADYAKGDLEIVNDKPMHYAYSNMFDVAAKSTPYEKVVVAINLDYVIETLRAEGTSPWYAAAHDEFALVMDGSVEVDLVKLDSPDSVVPPEKKGAVRVAGEPKGRKMGLVQAGRGHQVLLPKGAAYRFRATGKPGVIMMQTILGELSVQKWAEICYK
jgi:hypothetical protein